MTTIKLKLKDLNLRLAEKSAIYLTQKRHTKDSETPCFPDLLRTPDSQLKKLYDNRSRQQGICRDIAQPISRITHSCRNIHVVR